MSDHDPRAAARAAWGADAPDWVMELAKRCAESSQRKVAGKMGRSSSLVSQVLGNKYAGSLDQVENLVRGLFMRKVVECPALGELPTNECQEWQRKARRSKPANSLGVTMCKACLACPHRAGAKSSKEQPA